MATYPDQPNPDLLDRIPLSARVIYDVGCAAGALGMRHKRANPRARVFGIDRDLEAAAIAATRLDLVAAGDVEADPFPFATDDLIDCLVYGDVLEHLRDPWALVKRHLERLSPDGTILICLPNVEHWSFAARLLAGTWRYEDTGLLDRTHMRWFTLDSIGQALGELGLHPVDVKPRVFDAERADQFIAMALPTLTAMGVTPQDYRIRATPLQYVWRVCRAPRQRLSLAASMLKPVGGVSHIRVVYPLRALATEPAISVHIAQDRLPQPAPDSDRVFVLHRPVLAGDEGLRTLRTLMADGWLVVSEFDDQPDHFPAMRGEGVMTFTGVHAVQTTTPALAAILRASNPEVAVFPNAAASLPDIANFSVDGPMTLFFGALNRGADWADYMPALNNVLSLVGERLRVQVVHDQAFFDALDTPHKVFEATCDHDRYMALLGACEIAFMPLSDTPFNRAKSDLKFIEAGACRVAPLASRVVYGETAVDQATAMLFDDPAGFRMRLLRMVAIPDVARAVADRARDYVARERMLAYQVADRAAWYRDLLARRASLTEAVYARVPALRPVAAPAALPVHADAEG